MIDSSNGFDFLNFDSGLHFTDIDWVSMAEKECCDRH